MSDAAHGHGAVVSHFRQVSAAWNDRYDRAPRRMSDLDLQLRRDAALELLEPLIGPDAAPAHLLDVGCGSGSLLQRLAGERLLLQNGGSRRQGLKLHGVDLVPEMVAEARERVRGADLRLADATHLPWQDGSMQFVTCLGVLEYLGEAERALAEIRRVLCPGGVLIASFPNRLSIFRRLSRWEIALETAAAGGIRWLRGRRRDTSPRRPYAHAHWSAAEARRLLEASGFVIDAAQCNTYGLWGRVGRSRMALSLSRKLSQHFATPGVPARYFACTLVFRARKPGELEEGPRP